MTKTRLIAIVAAVALIVTGAVATGWWITRDTVDDPVPTGEAAPDGLAAFYEQELDWEECGRGRCTWVTVPVDYADPEGETLELKLRLIPTTGEGGRTLFVNPGGPGGSAVDFAGQLAALLSDEVRDVYDVVGVDPRGVGESTPLQCLDGPDFDEFIDVDPTPDEPAEVDLLTESVRELGQACAENTGALAGHVSTIEAVRDFDIVRALLGEDALDWFGASYGTMLGATYATLFPERVGRMVLDGAVDPSLDAFDGSMGQTVGFERALQAYAADCATDPACPLGTDPEAGVERVAALMAELDEQPLPGLGDRELTEGLAFYGVALPLYNELSWPALTGGFDAAFAGDGSMLMRFADAYFERGGDGTFGGNGGQVIYAVNCLDSDSVITEADVRDQLPRFEDASSVFGPGLAWGALACQEWPLEAAEPPLDIDGAGAPPILVLGTTRDPATPYEWAVSLAEQLASGVLVSRDGDGHTAYISGNQCIAEVVDSFLIDGTVPDADPHC